MSLLINSAAKVACKNCRTPHAISPEEFGKPRVDYMGCETSIYWLHDTKCTKCDAELYVGIEAFEHPNGIINCTNNYLGGCRFLKKPTLVFKDEPDISDKSEIAREILIQQRHEYRKNLKKAEDELGRVFWENQRDFIAKTIPYKVGDVIEITGDKRKHKRMAVYEIIINWMFDMPMVALYGWYLDKNSTPVKWEANGVYVYGIEETGCAIKMSENQENKPVPAKFKTVD